MTNPNTVSQPLDEQLVKQCQAIIRANAHKGDSWKTCSEDYLIAKLTEEFAEVIKAYSDLGDSYYLAEKEQIGKELADLINVAAMLHQRFRRV